MGREGGRWGRQRADVLTAAMRKEKDIGCCVGAASGMMREVREREGLRGDIKRRRFGDRIRGRGSINRRNLAPQS